jgi:hypothetical protein
MSPPSHEWTEYATAKGWEAVYAETERLAREQCGGANLLMGTVGATNAHVVYGLRCPFWHSHACRWQARIRIPRDQVCSGEGGLWVALVTPQYRAEMHKDHMCILEVTRDRNHVDHFGRQGTRAHRAWVAAASQDSAMLCWSRKQIYKWLEDRVPGADVPMAHRCKKWCERKRHASTRARVGIDVPLDTVAGLRTLAFTFAFETVAAQDHFSPHKAYLCPGWFINDDGMCLIFTTFNFMLNIYRASCHPAGLGTVYALDHSYKVLMHIHFCVHGLGCTDGISRMHWIDACGEVMLCLAWCCLPSLTPFVCAWYVTARQRFPCSPVHQRHCA